VPLLRFDDEDALDKGRSPLLKLPSIFGRDAQLEGLESDGDLVEQGVSGAFGERSLNSNPVVEYIAVDAMLVL